MTWLFSGDQAGRYKALASQNWSCSEKDEEPTVLDYGVEALTLVQRGAYTTDYSGVAISINGQSISLLMRNLLNQAWDLWVRPEVERYKDSDIDIPDELRSILLKNENGKMCMSLNPEFSAEVLVRANVSLKKGDGLEFSDILDFTKATPPKTNEKPTSYILIKLRGKQVSVVFDFRPGHESFPTHLGWSDSDCRWFGHALAEESLAGVYGHIIFEQRFLLEANIPFSIGLPPKKMNVLLETSKIGSAEAEKALNDELSSEDWQHIIDVWKKLPDWDYINHIFDELFVAYNHRLYTAVINLALPLIEGIIMRYLIVDGKALRDDGQAKRWSVVVQELEMKLSSQDFGAVRSTLAKTLISFLRSSSLYQPFTWKEGREAIGRHSILHGYEVNHGRNKANADRVLMVIDSLYWLTGVSE